MDTDRLKKLAGCKESIHETMSEHDHELMSITSEIFDLVHDLRMSQHTKHAAHELNRLGQRLQRVTGDQ